MDLSQFLQKTAPKPLLPFSLVEGGIPQGSLIELSGSTGGGKLEALMRFLSENSALQVAWVEEGATAYPCAFPQHGVSLERLLFVNAAAREGEGQLFMECAHQILRSQAFGVLVLMPRDSVAFGEKVSPHNHPITWRSAVTISDRDAGTVTRGSKNSNGAFRPEPRGLGEIELRRLQIAAEKSATTVFIIRETPSKEHTWPLAAQFHVQRVTPSLGDLRGEIKIEILKCRFQPRLKEQETRAFA